MVERATAHDVVDRIEATGQLLAKSEATVAAQVTGEVTSIAADEGTAVELDQVIVEIDPERRQLELDDARARRAQAKAQRDEAVRDLKRAEKLKRSGIASQVRLDETRTQVELTRAQLLAAQARVGLAERALADANVTAPFAGLVARRLVNVGEFVSTGQNLFSLVALDPIEVEFFLPEVDSSRVAEGQTVEVRVASHPDEVFRGKVSVVAPTIDSVSRTRRVKATIQNADGRLLPGTFARADLGVAEKSGVIMIPKEAVLLRADGAVVFKLAPSGNVERLQVEAGRHRGPLVEIVGSVAAGDWIVVRGQANLVDGSPVSLRNEDGTPFDVAAGEGPSE
jgi:membrane fusion protein (multidrug efflux system)